MSPSDTLVSPRPKDAQRSRAGRIGMDARWHPLPRVVDIGDLNNAQRRLVLALVDAARKTLTDKPA